jgi:2-polyprenyl-6-methoxyphenol hydroxylase-like FAD-dependent oxidoreductase
VLVVGAGPTGLVLAAELLARGIRTRVIDKGDGVALQTRAIGIHARTLEVLDMMGLAGRFTECGQVVRRLRFYSRGRCLTSLEFARCGSRFGFLLDLPQDQTERLLRARIADLGGAIEQGAELTGLTPQAGAVTATVRHPEGQTQTITAGYVVGCDGAHSRVRRELGLTFDGHPYPQTGCSPTCCSAVTCRRGTCVRTRYTRSSGRTGCRSSSSRCAGTGGG